MWNNEFGINKYNSELLIKFTGFQRLVAKENSSYIRANISMNVLNLFKEDMDSMTPRNMKSYLTPKALAKKIMYMGSKPINLLKLIGLN